MGQLRIIGIIIIDFDKPFEGIKLKFHDSSMEKK